MAEQIVQQNRMAPFIEKRSEQLLASIFGDPNAVRESGESDAAYNMRKFGLAGTQYDVPGQQLAGFTAPQMQAFDLAGQGIGSWAPWLQKAGAQADLGGLTGLLAGQTLAGGFGGFDPTTQVDPYMNQYNEHVLNKIREQGDIAKNKMAGQAVQRGVFGGAREGLQAGQMDTGIGAQIGLQSQKNYESALKAAMAGHSDQQRRQLMAGQQLGKLSQTQGQLGGLYGGLGSMEQRGRQGDIRSLLGIGGMQQKFGQTALDLARANEIARQREPFTRAGFASDILRGVPSSSMQYTTQPSPSPWLQAAGMGIAGLSGLGAFGEAFPNNPMTSWLGGGN